MATDRFTFETHPHGVGGFGRIIRGRDNFLERDIAVKVLDPLAKAFHGQELERFKREARILASLSHPNIPAIYDVDFSDGHFDIIFQFIDGENLKAIISGGGACTLGDTVKWFRQIASALDQAHQKGVVHRDVKPSNIIITPDRETAYLVDFGIALAKAESKQLTGDGYVIGTPGYMAPEQQAGEDVDYRSDVYSLAVTLYESLAGKSLAHGEYEALSLVNQAVPPEIDSLIQDCLVGKEARNISAKVFAQRLGESLRAAKPLADVLAHGRLHELANAIEELTAADLAKLPQGQRKLILAKLDDIVHSGEPSLRFASERLLNLLLIRGLLLDPEDYREVAEPSVDWGFKRQPDGRIGRESIQKTFEEAAFAARGQNYTVLEGAFLGLLGSEDLGSIPVRCLHAIREVLEALLANPACGDNARALAEQRKNVNRIQRSRE